MRKVSWKRFCFTSYIPKWAHKVYLHSPLPPAAAEGQDLVVRDEVLKKTTDVVHKAVVVEAALAEGGNSEEVFVHGQW